MLCCRMQKCKLKPWTRVALAEEQELRLGEQVLIQGGSTQLFFQEFLKEKKEI